MKKYTVLFALMASLFLLAACGGAAEPAGPEPVSLTFTGGDEFRYDPASATVPAGANVTVTYENVGALEHNWLLVSDRVDPLEATEADAIGGATSGVIAGGTSSTFNFVAPQAGEYQYVCTVPGHAAAGMVGTLTVTP